MIIYFTITLFNESFHTIVIDKRYKLIIKNSVLLWHERLGYISKKRIERFVFEYILDPFDFSDSLKDLRVKKNKL